MITSKLPKELNMNSPATTPTYHIGGLCTYMSDCPDIGCKECMGKYPLAQLRAIEPELTNENILKVINVYEVLIK